MSLYMLQHNIAYFKIITKAIDIVLTTLDLWNCVNTKQSSAQEPLMLGFLFGYFATLLGVAYPAGCVSCDLNGELIIYAFPENGTTVLSG